MAVSVLRLRDEGALDLSDAVGEHVSELAELPVTVGQLLSHTSGFHGATPGPWWEHTPGVPFSPQAVSSWLPAGRPTVGTWSAPPLFQPGLCRPGGTRRPRPFRHRLAMSSATNCWSPWACGVRPCDRSLRTSGASPVHPHAGLVMDEPEHDVSGHGTGRPAMVDATRTLPAGLTCSREGVRRC